MAQSTGMGLTQAGFHFFEQFVFECFTAEKPAALERLPFRGIVVAGFASSLLHALLD